MWKESESSVFSWILLMRAGESDEHELDGSAIITLVVLVVQHELLGAESLGGLDSVTNGFGRRSSSAAHSRGRKVCNAIHSTVGEMIPNGVLEINEAAGREKGVGKPVRR
ncbi:hypothetical protein MHU86_23013 [Fragilaria crotonensis]|nr:hypothetical protein MHU86_23013 [Fragilaria crotonensis]